MGSVAVVPLDIHKRFTRATPMSAEAEVLSDDEVRHDGPEELRRYFDTFEPGTDVVMEATFNWPWIADLAEECGLSPHLAHPSRAREMAKGMAKSDRKDAVFLGRLWLAGDIFPESYLAPVEVRRMRGLFRLRQLMVRMRTMMKNALHGQLHRLGIMLEVGVFSKTGLARLEGVEMPEFERRQLGRRLAVIGDLAARIAEVEEEIRADLKEDGRARLLMTLPGIGEILAYAIMAEIGEVERFPNPRALAAYAGLLPQANESGGRDFGRRTAKQCNRFLRWAMIEGVTGAVRKSPRMRSLHSRVKERNKKKAGKARVAVARELIELVHLILTKCVPYAEERPPRPGSESTRERSRPNRASRATLCARPARGQADM